MPETTTFLLVTSTKFTDFKNISTGRLSNKRSLMRLLTSPPNLKYVATLPCNLSLIASFLTVMLHKVVWQHLQSAMKSLIAALLHIYYNLTVKEF